MRRGSEVAPKRLLRSLVIRKERDSFEMALESGEKGRGKRGEKGEKEGCPWWVASPLDHHGMMLGVR